MADLEAVPAETHSAALAYAMDNLGAHEPGVMDIMRLERQVREEFGIGAFDAAIIALNALDARQQNS